MRMGYHQIPLTEESMEKNAFTSPDARYQFCVLPFGLKDAPACYQRIVNDVLLGLAGNCTHVYLDDIVVQGSTFDEHVQNLIKVLERL